MISSKNRLKKSQVTKTLSLKQKIRDKNIFVSYFAYDKNPLFSVVVPKKNIKKAVDRHYYKRMMYDLCLKYFKKNGIYIFQYNGKEMEYNEIEKEMKDISSKI